jgi:hypothetical protein
MGSTMIKGHEIIIPETVLCKLYPIFYQVLQWYFAISSIDTDLHYLLSQISKIHYTKDQSYFNL